MLIICSFFGPRFSLRPPILVLMVAVTLENSIFLLIFNNRFEINRTPGKVNKQNITVFSLELRFFFHKRDFSSFYA